MLSAVQWRWLKYYCSEELLYFMQYSAHTSIVHILFYNDFLQNKNILIFSEFLLKLFFPSWIIIKATQLLIFTVIAIKFHISCIFHVWVITFKKMLSSVLSWGHIFSCVWPSCEWAVSNLDPLRYMNRPVKVAHSSFTEWSHMTKYMASGHLHFMFSWVTSQLLSSQCHPMQWQPKGRLGWLLLFWAKTLSSKIHHPSVLLFPNYFFEWSVDGHIKRLKQWNQSSQADC